MTDRSVDCAPSATALRSARLARKIPLLHPIQRLPWLSSRIAKTLSSCRPSRVVIELSFPSLNRFNPPLAVPIQTVPVESSWTETTKLLDRPLRVVNEVAEDP